MVCHESLAENTVSEKALLRVVNFHKLYCDLEKVYMTWLCEDVETYKGKDRLTELD